MGRVLLRSWVNITGFWFSASGAAGDGWGAGLPEPSRALGGGAGAFAERERSLGDEERCPRVKTIG